MTWSKNCAVFLESSIHHLYPTKCAWPGGQVPKAELTKTPRDEDDEEALFPLELSRALGDLWISRIFWDFIGL